ncbi:MAG: hypothetical protein EOP46_14285, partial [Sphingobacteriaceae bacterium]
MNKTLLFSCGFTRNYSRFNINLTNKFVKCFSRLLLFVLLFLSAGLQDAFADGSADLYRAGTGSRAYLMSKSAPWGGTNDRSWPFINSGVHYVYAAANERISVASSAQGSANAFIRLTSPTGIVSTTTSGNIGTRLQEMAGPGASGGYTPYTTPLITGNQVGIWKIEFISTGGETAADFNTGLNTLASAAWTQPTNSAMIAAWDISVRNSANNAYVPGRVYANVLNMIIGADAASVFNGVFHVITKDGYTYRVNNNGNNGIGFTFFVNNKGFLDGSGNASYTSVAQASLTGTQIAAQTINPSNADTQTSITHKIFYTVPNSGLPEAASGSVPGGSTWLRATSRATPNVNTVGLVGVEGQTGQVSSKGGFIKFNAALAGAYTIRIQSTATPSSFPTRTLTGTSVSGDNSIPWDGKDGAGTPLPTGNSPVRVTVQLQGAEVHFPFIDMEVNPGGTIIELLTANLSATQSDIVYWRDPATWTEAGRPTILDGSQFNGGGTSSNGSGHKWSSNYGDNRGMDTWSFVLGAVETLNTTVAVKQANLEVTSITEASSSMTIGGNMSYTVVVRNNGPSDVTTAPFAFTVPAGFEVVSGSVIGTTLGASADAGGAPSADKLKFNSTLNMPNNSTVTYTVQIKAASTSTINNPFTVQASILRPADVTDLDATNPNTTGVPSNPQLECTGNVPASAVTPTRPFGCNNIAVNSVVSVASSIIPVTETGSVPVSVIGTIAVSNVAANDTVNGAPATLGGSGNATVAQFGTWPSGITLNTTTGAINVAALTPRGAYNVTYQLCDNLTPANCATVVDRINVTGVAPVAVADNQTGLEDNPITFDVTANDTDLDGNTTINKSTVLLIDPADNVKKTTVIIANQGTWTVNTTNGIVTFTPIANYNGSPTVIRYTVKDDEGLESNAANITATVTPVNDAPSFTAGGNQMVAQCAISQSITNWATAISPGPANESTQTVSFLVTVPSADVTKFTTVPAVSPSGTLTYTLASTFFGTVTVTVVAQDNGGTDNNGIDKSAPQTFTITASAVSVAATINATSPTTCNGTNGQIVLGNLTNGITYTVNYTKGGAAQTAIVAIPTNNAITISNLSSGVYANIVVSTGTCSSSALSATLVNPAPAQSGAITGATSICAPSPAQTYAVAAVVDATSYTWTYSGTGATITSPNAASTSITFTAGATSGTLSVTATNACGTSAPRTQTITINPTPATPTVTAGGPTTFCNGGSVVLTSSSTTGNQWYNGTTLLSGATNRTYTATVSGNYNVVVTAAGCSSAPSANTSVTVNPIPATPTVTAGGPTNFCTGGNVVLTSSSATGNQWYNGALLISGATNQTYTATTSGNYNVVVTTTGCSSAASASTSVTVNPLPTAYNVTGGGAYCSSGSGVVVGLSNSQTGINYQLQNNNVNTGTAIAGTGAAISFGNQIT